MRYKCEITSVNIRLKTDFEIGVMGMKLFLGSEFHQTKYIIIIRMKYRSDSDFAIEIALHSCKLLHHVPLIAAAIAITGTGGTKMRMKFKYKKIKSIRDKSISNRWRRGKNIQRGASLSISNHSR